MIFLESFKNNVNKHFEKLNENYNFYEYLFLLLAEAWVVPNPLQLFRGCEGKASPFPPMVYTVQCTVYNETSQFFQFPI